MQIKAIQTVVINIDEKKTPIFRSITIETNSSAMAETAGRVGDFKRVGYFDAKF